MLDLLKNFCEKIILFLKRLFVREVMIAVIAQELYELIGMHWVRNKVEFSSYFENPQNNGNLFLIVKIMRGSLMSFS